MTTALLLSGGVDSSVALVRLLESGERDVAAFYLKVWLEEELAGFGDCPWQEDLEYVRRVCDRFDVPLRVVPLQREYREQVVEYALAELRAGRTPSPDVLCNRRIKFAAFLDALGAGGAAGEGAGRGAGGIERVATGHYARRIDTPDGPLLGVAADPVKDQTYFLAQLTRDQLRRCRFPLTEPSGTSETGELTKRDVRRLAAELGLPTASRPDSQGICFLGEIPFDAFVRAHLGERPGPIREAGSGRTLGEHRGHWFHTIGQRKGLGLSGGPWFVVAKEVATDTLWVTHGEQLEERAPDRFTVPAPHWIAAPPAPDAPAVGPDGSAGPLRVKVRHGPAAYGCTIAPLPDGGLDVRLDTPDPGLAPGQFAVFYQGEICLGGGAMEPAAARGPGPSTSRDRCRGSRSASSRCFGP